jgi:hypothetical protein
MLGIGRTLMPDAMGAPPDGASPREAVSRLVTKLIETPEGEKVCRDLETLAGVEDWPLVLRFLAEQDQIARQEASAKAGGAGQTNAGAN